MTAGEHIEYTFADQADARSYLTDVTRLWIAWLIALALLMTTNGLVLVVVGFAVVAGWVILGRPIQRRAEAMVPDDPVPDETPAEAAQRRRVRDRVVKQLTFGAEPLEAALEAAGLDRRIAWLRWVMIAATVLAFWLVIRAFFGA